MAGPWQGNSSGWADLLARQARENGRLLFRLAYGVLRDSAAAEDACQQAFLKACSAEQKIRDHDHLRAWLSRTVVNESLQCVRRRKIEREVLSHQSAQSKPAGSYQSEALREELLLGMEQLEDEVRIVVALRLIDGLSGNEVKEILGCSAADVIATAASRVGRFADGNRK